MVKSDICVGLTLLTLYILISSTIGETSALQVNETIKGFRISFDSIDDTNMVAKFWSNGSVFYGQPWKGQLNELVSGIMLLAGNASDPDRRLSGCLVLVLKNPENTSSKNTETMLLQNNTNRYVRVFDRLVDGHKGLLLKAGNEPSDPLMRYTAMYWLNEVQGKATKFVYVISGWPDKETERLLNTIHVEEIKQIPS